MLFMMRREVTLMLSVAPFFGRAVGEQRGYDAEISLGPCGSS
jgi:hypothetical protein